MSYRFSSGWARKPSTVIATVFVSLLPWPGLAQTFLGSIGGAVRDATGAVVPQAKVALAEKSTGVQRTAESNAEGNYHFANLPLGTYTVTVSKAGFKEARSGVITLSTQQAVRFDLALEVGDVTQAVEVSAGAAGVSTETARLGDIRPRQDLLNLPLNSRSTLSYFYLTPYVYSGDSVGGLRYNDLNYTIDGVTSNSAVFGGRVGPMIEVALESVQEMTIMATNNSAEYPKVATLFVTTRSGTNDLHGSAFWDHSNNAFNARNFFAPTKPKGPSRHEFGGSLSGPVYLPKLYDGRNRSFFHFTWERAKFPGLASVNASVPTLKMRAGDFSDLLPRTVVRDYTTGQPFPGNVIPASRISQVARNTQSYKDFIPAPNFGLPELFNANYRYLRPTASRNDRFTIRGDHQLSNSDTLSARVAIRSSPFRAYDGALPAFQRQQTRQTRNAYLSETHLFSPTVVNEARIGFSRDFSRLAGDFRGADVVEALGLQGIKLDNKRGLAGVPSFRWNNFSTIANFPTYFWMTETFELLDNLTWTKGRHVIKAGLLHRYNRVNISHNPSGAGLDGDFGTFIFDGFASGFDYADFLLGVPHNSSRLERVEPAYNRYSETGLFVQDDWRVSSKLTLNLGLRYEYVAPPAEKYDRRFAFDSRTGNLVVPNQDVLQKLVNPLFPKTIPIVTAQNAGFPARSLVSGDRNNFGPRVGFAWRPFGDSRTVVRSGYGVYYSSLAWTLLDSFTGGPFRSDEQFLNDITGGAPLFQFPRPFTAVGTIPTQSVGGVVVNPRTTYTQQWNLTVEREVGASVVARLSYRGFRTNKLLFEGDINKPFPSSDPAQRSFFRYPQFFRTSFAQNGAIQKMHALDVSAERKFTQGLTFQSGWTWAKDLSDYGSAGQETGFIENPYDRRREMADVGGVNRHRFVTSLLWEVPFGTGKRFGAGLPAVARQALGNWAISAATVFQSGQLLTPGFTGSDPSNTRTIGGRPDRIGEWKLPNATIDRWFNPAAFAVPPVGRFGSSARNVIYGPGVANFDFGLFKYFTLREGARLQLRMTATNFFNHPNFGDPNTNISAAAVGTIRSLRGGDDTFGAGARLIRLGLRLDF